MDYKDDTARHLRITILRLLHEQNSYSLNESLLLDVIDRYGFRPSRDSLIAQLAWLEEQRLVSLSGPDHCRVATLSTRGADVAEGRKIITGVKHPRPGER